MYLTSDSDIPGRNILRLGNSLYSDGGINNAGKEILTFGQMSALKMIMFAFYRISVHIDPALLVELKTQLNWVL